MHLPTDLPRRIHKLLRRAEATASQPLALEALTTLAKLSPLALTTLLALVDPAAGSAWSPGSAATSTTVPSSSSTMQSDSGRTGSSSSEELWDLWSDRRFVSEWAPRDYRHQQLTADLERLQRLYPDLEVVLEGRSFEGRSIHRLRIGSGPMPVLLWSQMHGDEPSATPALLDLVHFLLSEPDSRWAEPILSRLTLDIVPMLNPDGAERYTRRNAQAIDINRDALHLATPEGRLLKQIRDRGDHELGFNLHDQGRRKEVGETGVLATAAVLAVAGDEAKTVTPGRRRAMRVCAAIVAALHRRYPGGVARYNDSFNERAFGDNVTAWGTPVALLESGGLPEGEPVEHLVRRNFVALLHSLAELARNDAADHAESLYATLPFNRSGPWVDVLVQGAELQQSAGSPAYVADLAFDVERADRAPEVDLEEWLREDRRPARSRIREVGDARALEGSIELELPGHRVVPALQVTVRGWRRHRDLFGDLASPGRASGGLERLARHGVGTVHWLVSARRLDEALELAAARGGDGRPEIVVHERSSSVARRFPLLRDPSGVGLGDEGGETTAPRFGALLAALGAPEPEFAWTPLADGKPPLRPDATASFLVLAPAEHEETPIEERSLHSIWIDGQRVR